MIKIMFPLSRPFLLLLLAAFAGIFVNLAYLDYRDLADRRVPYSSPPAAIGEFSGRAASPSGRTSDCPPACGDRIDFLEERLARLETLSSPPDASVSLPKPTIIPTPALQIVYFPLGSGGSTTMREWVKIDGSEFNFDLKDYPSGASVRWQGNLKVKDPNSRCFARIYDSSNKRAVDFSEQATGATEFETITSSPLSIWQGPNHYYLEIKSLDGSVCSLSSPRLVISYRI